MPIHPILIARVLLDAMQTVEGDSVPPHLQCATLVGYLPTGELTAREGAATVPLLVPNTRALTAAGLSTDMVAWPLLKSGLGRIFSSSTFKIGRDRGCDVVLPDMQVSKVHAALSMRYACIIKDVGSSNQTIVNGVPLQGERTLVDGDRLSIGGVSLIYLAGGRLLQVLRSNGP